jgi:hypothetical protein
MKFFTLLSLSLILTNRSMSQINKGQFLVGGNISFESIKNDGEDVVNYKTTNFFVSPNIGYFIIPKLVGGLRLNIRSYKQKIPASYTQVSVSLSPFLRYYLLSQKQKFNVLVDAGYINVKTKTTIQNSPTYAERTRGYTISVGPSIFLNERVALEFLLGYKRTNVKNYEDNKNTTLNTGLGLQIHLGKLRTKPKA